MTIFGIDISHHQSGIDLRKIAVESKMQFAIAKMTEGKGYKDPLFRTYQEQAQEAGLLFAGYHFLRGDSLISEQVLNVREVVGDSNIPVIIDIERTNGSQQPTMADARAFRALGSRNGLNVADLLYLPHWYWAEIGLPSLAGWHLWQSSYGLNTGEYPGDQSPKWSYTDGVAVSVLQYTSAGRVSGYSGNLDINAYRGTREELAQTGWFIDYKEDEVATKEEIQEWVATAPIVVDNEGTVWPLQRVLRRILTDIKAESPTSPAEIASAVVAALPPDQDLTAQDIERAVARVFRVGADGVG